MNFFIRGLVLNLTLVICFFVVTSDQTSAAEQDSFKLKGYPVYLKINDYQVLYTYPKSPYVDEKNRLMVPLRSVGELLGFNVKFDHITKTARISKDGKFTELTLQDDVASVNGQSVKMDTKPVLESQSMFVPLRIILTTFNIHGAYNQKTGLVEIDDNRLTTQLMTDLEDFYRLNLWRQWNSDGFRIMESLPIIPQLKDDRGGDMTLTLKAKNVSGYNLTEGQTAINIIYLSQHTKFPEQIAMSASRFGDSQGIYTGAAKNGQIIQLQQNYYIQPNHKMLYILALGSIAAKE